MIDIFFYSFIEVFIMLTYFFFNLPKKDLFNGKKWDLLITIAFGWMLPIHFCFPFIWKILILDQVSRHVYRDNKAQINKHTLKMLGYIFNLENSDISNMNLNELTFTSLAVRHLLRLVSNNKLIANGNHQLISHKMELLITAMELRLDSSQYSTEVSRAIHSHNKYAMRRFKYIKPNYQPWAVVPDPNVTSSFFIDFLNTEIGQFVIGKIEQLLKKVDNNNNKMITICVMCSGGIDSMTLVRICNGLRLTKRFPNVRFSALHINWRYRNESTIEAEQLGWVLSAWEIDYQIVNSPIDPHNPKWDQLSSDFRFELMKQQPDWIYCMGHVVTDMIENLVCNVCIEGSSTGKQTYFDLFGMKEISSITNSICLFRPLLLHRKPNDLDTPHLLDNAQNLDIKRRVVRRAMSEFDFDLSRISYVYNESIELQEKYNLKIPFKCDPAWTLSEWRQVLAPYQVKKGIIRELMSLITHKDTFTIYKKGLTIDVRDGFVFPQSY